MSLYEGASIYVIGRVYGRHPANAAKWLARAREQLQRDFRKRLASRLGPLEESFPGNFELLTGTLAKGGGALFVWREVVWREVVWRE